ncbi:MAG: SET domain-containing protein-lysine N-methyltransferase [Gammaproteobacteria bacterium]|nr:SET domain-containing protein-lysine N-methyltransferase [Gammaproteobacteria bacterium]
MKKKSQHHAHMRHAARTSSGHEEDSPLYEVRRSGIHGKGVYARRRIPKGTRIVEYLGDRISHEAADARYAAKGQDDGHTFLFVVSDDIVIDAGVGGNDARFINHSCAPNCDTVIEDDRVFIEALRDIKPGEELGYEYGLTWESTDDPDELANYDCRCGAPNCRGTMLDEVPLDARKPAKRKKAAQRKKVAKKKPATRAGKSRPR